MAVFRTSSPDGLSGVYVLPRVDWSWSSGAKQLPAAAGCMPWTRIISARDYLTYLLPILKVGFVRELDSSQDIASLKRSTDELNAKSRPLTTFSGDAAEFLVRYELNGHPVEEVLYASVSLADRFFRETGAHVYKCTAFVKRFRAPLGKLQEQAAMLKSVQGSFDQQWNAQWMALWAQKMREDVGHLYGEQTKALLAAGQRAGDLRMQQHQEFMKSMQGQADARRYQFQEGQFRKQHASDDFVDHVLDCYRLQNGVSVGRNCPNRQTAP